jgi:hypothetical protein
VGRERRVESLVMHLVGSGEVRRHAVQQGLDTSVLDCGTDEDGREAEGDCGSSESLGDVEVGNGLLVQEKIA